MTPPRILIIEDVPQIADSLVDSFHMKGWQTLVAPDGGTGVALAFREHPDLILLDMRLPDIDGYEVFRRIRQDEWGKQAEIIIITASESTTMIAAQIDLPVDRILFKPEWSLLKLTEKIEAILAE